MKNWFYVFVVLNIYRFFLLPLALFLLWIGSFFGSGKLKKTFRMRRNHEGKHPIFSLPSGQRPLWFHCASGEFEYAKPVIQATKARYPQIPILVTYHSPSFQREVEENRDVDMSCPLPWDFRGAMKTFIQHHRPRALLIARTDLWPEMLYQVRREGINSLLFSATKSTPTKFERLISGFMGWRYRQLNAIYCVSQEDRLHFMDLGASQVQVKGDTRYDQVFLRLKEGRPHKEFLFRDRTSPLLIAGSSWAEDEVVLLEACSDLLRQGQLRVIIAPHEPTPERLSHLSGALKAIDIDHQLYTEVQRWDRPLLIVDYVGVLADLYQYSDLALIGGSFKSKVHSVMEALGAGCPVFLGPYYQNNREALEFQQLQSHSQRRLNWVNVVDDSEGLREELNTFLQHRDKWPVLRNEIMGMVTQKRGTTQSVLHWVQNVLAH